MAKKSEWVFTKGRKDNILRASKIHREMVRLGKELYYKKHPK